MTPKKTTKTAKKAQPASQAAPAPAPDGPIEVKKPLKPTKKTPAKLSPDVIARAAYLNYRRRIEQGLPGDSHGDWLEAERYFSGKNES